MWKPILAGTAALAIAGTSFVYAQQRSDGGPANWRPSQEDRAAFTDARIAALKAGLRLTPDQEKNWPAFEAALRDIAKSRMDRSERSDEARADDRSSDPIQRLRRHAEMMTNAGQRLTRLADAEEPLYQSLDDSQKRRFQMLSNVLTASNKHFAQLRGHHRHEMRGEDRRHDGNRGPSHDRGRGSDDRSGDNQGSRGMGERL
jgi:methylphosphotriester-DNA--protein-cysteine methyltransferase